MSDSEATELNLDQYRKKRSHHQGAITRVKHRIQVVWDKDSPDEIYEGAIAERLKQLDEYVERGMRTHDYICAKVTNEEALVADEDARDLYIENVSKVRALAPRLRDVKTAFGFSHEASTDLDNLEDQKRKKPNMDHSISSEPVSSILMKPYGSPPLSELTLCGRRPRNSALTSQQRTQKRSTGLSFPHHTAHLLTILDGLKLPDSSCPISTGTSYTGKNPGRCLKPPSTTILECLMLRSCHS